MDLYINLQLFADEKTEKPTPKKKREAREKGQVAQSREINSAFVLIGCFLVMYLYSSYMMDQFKINARYMLTMDVVDGLYTAEGIRQLFISSVITVARVAGPVAGTALGIGLIASYAQVGFLFTTKPLTFKPDKLNPIEGLKRIFSRRSLAQLMKSLLRITIIGYISYRYLISQYSGIPRLLNMEIEEITRFIGITTINIGFRAGAVLLVLAVIDFFFEKYEFQRNIMMTKQELKEEYKQTEGNPQIKARIREKQRQISMRRMMAEVPKADVVITNPTHFAVALKYDAEIADAPHVVAKGQDLIALKIKEIARENNVEVVENPPLARNIYQETDIGDVIPSDLYQAVAEVIAFVYSLKNNR